MKWNGRLLYYSTATGSNWVAASRTMIARMGGRRFASIITICDTSWLDLPWLDAVGNSLTHQGYGSFRWCKFQFYQTSPSLALKSFTSSQYWISTLLNERKTHSDTEGKFSIETTVFECLDGICLTLIPIRWTCTVPWNARHDTLRFGKVWCVIPVEAPLKTSAGPLGILVAPFYNPRQEGYRDQSRKADEVRSSRFDVSTTRKEKKKTSFQRTSRVDAELTCRDNQQPHQCCLSSNPRSHGKRELG